MYESEIRHLQTCAAIDACELYVSVVDNNKRFGVRLWGGLENMTADEAQKFCDEFNTATALVRRKWLQRYREKVTNALFGGRDIIK